jgi:hypothetical protein
VETTHLSRSDAGSDGFCGRPDDVEYEIGVGKHRDVAAVHVIGPRAHALGRGSLELGLDGPVMIGTMYQLGLLRQAVPSAFWLNRSASGAMWVAHTSFCSCSERSPANAWVPSGSIQMRPSATLM